MNTTNNRNKNLHNKIINLFRKCKTILINKLLKFINNKIKEIYNNNIDNRTRLFILNKNLVESTRLDFNLMLLQKSLLEIFSENNINRIIIYHLDPNWNKRLIEKLLNEKDDDKRKYFENLFNLTFLDYLDHFTTKRVIEELQGLKTFLDIKNDENELKRLKLDDKEYLNSFEDFLNNYEEKLKLLNKKRKRSYSKFMHKLINIKN